MKSMEWGVGESERATGVESCFGGDESSFQLVTVACRLPCLRFANGRDTRAERAQRYGCAGFKVMATDVVLALGLMNEAQAILVLTCQLVIHAST